MATDASPARPLGRPRDARADRAIIVAALDLIAERGVAAVRMDDVAERAGVGKATIYRRYRSKDELVTDAVGSIVSTIEIPDSGSTRTDLLILMRQAVELFSSSFARLMPTLVDEMSRNAELAEVARDRFLTGRRAALSTVFDRGIERGDLDAGLDVELALDILAGPLFYRLLITGGPVDDRLAEGVVELVLRGFAPHTRPASAESASDKPPTTKDTR
jgi:AcrR family transcriptional regulator